MAARQSGHGPDDSAPVFVISVAAQLSGMHAQTLRQYDRLGLVSPARTRGGGRRYSGRDITLLREVQHLSQQGVSLAGIQRVLELANQVTALRSRVSELTDQVESLRLAGTGSRVFVAGSAGIVALRPGERPPRSAGALGPAPGQRSTGLALWRQN